MREIAGSNGSEARRPERRVLREEVRDQLIKAILDGHLAPGDRIVEMRIAQQFGVSQTPVREALRDLELFGFIASSPFKGATVRQMSTEDHLTRISDLVVVLSPAEQASGLDFPGL